MTTTKNQIRLRRIAIWILPVIVIALVFVFVNHRFGHFPRRCALIKPGATAADVEEVLGPAYLTLQRHGGRGELFVWTDLFWQVDVYTNENDEVVDLRCVPANSWYRRLEARVSATF